jgi:hypothetical protein
VDLAVNLNLRLQAAAVEIDHMATREKRLAQFDGSGDPPPDQPVEVLCEDHSGTYHLPFACRWIDGHGAMTGPAAWSRHRVGWRCRARDLKVPETEPDAPPLCQNATRSALILMFGTRWNESRPNH